MAYGFESNGTSIQSHKWYVGGTEKLKIDANGDLNVTGKINLTDAGGNVAKKVAGFFSTESYLSLDNIKVACTRIGAGGGAGMSLGAVTTSFNASISASYAANGGAGGTANYNGSYTTTPSSSLFNWGVAGAGDTYTFLINDLTNIRFYRVIVMIGYGYQNNFLSIERLY